jgi:hypothetical protein
MFLTGDRIVRGHATRQYDKPEWAPLLELAADHIDDSVDPQRILREVLRRRGE